MIQIYKGRSRKYASIYGLLIIIYKLHNDKTMLPGDPNYTLKLNPGIDTKLILGNRPLALSLVLSMQCIKARGIFR